MSGTAALAAARRRRAGGANAPAPPVTRETPTPKSVLNPLQILQQHDKQILALTRDLDTIKSQNTPVTSEDIDFYKNKYSSLLSEMTEMKTNFVKMQTFCMETNMKVDAMNKKIEQNNLETND